MNLQEKWLSSFENKADVLQNSREEAIAVFKEKGFPTRKDEAWKFTSLSALLKNDFSIKGEQTTVSLEQIRGFFTDENSYKFVFINGFFSKELSDANITEFMVSPLAEILQSNDAPEFIGNYFNKETRKNDVFTALNTAFTHDGICIYIAKNKAIEKPIELLYIATDTKMGATCYQPHNIIEVGENAQVRIIERHQNISENAVLTNAVTEIFVRKSAILDYYKIQNDHLNASLIDNTYISQEENSNASVHTFSFGGNLTRNNLNFLHHGEHLESTLKGISILSGTQHVDNYTLVNHAQPNCESHQDYKAILCDQSSGVFNGKIMVEKIAQKTNAYQQNDTILLSEKATINTKPQLEIFADDVKCSHGCTVGELNKEALFYLQTRGIPKKSGEALLTYAFANTVLESVKIPALEEKVSEMISQKLGVNISM
ncbi:Fe-S cluster assembly protein SufD [Capnocytophaga sp.]|uniref:Fe-S cluster assembly protein SufD n=1 Tax=Capnocytophaga sp. TaxID=44737 RepID=UPI0026DD2197|nr:Fe-S cluster assembly protein SufD [Capnocytophaga sp.]MDO5106333.1 Fe-S cluster assembly protein SufD [Capnocytophaga sp.]